ncbi:unnamed protein product, partial [marine sediment metagenome]
MDVDKDIDKIREEYDLLKYWIYFNACGAMIPGNYWLKAEEDFLDFQGRGSIDRSLGGIATHPWLIHTYYECNERAAKLINAKPSEVTHMYRVVTAANLIINN